MSHTPGPWTLATSCSWRRIVTLHGLLPVCVPTVERDGHPDLNVSEDDARLLVAAPLLLAALREVLATVKATNALPGTVADFEKKMDRIRAASKQAHAAIAAATEPSA